MRRFFLSQVVTERQEMVDALDGERAESSLLMSEESDELRDEEVQRLCNGVPGELLGAVLTNLVEGGKGAMEQERIR